MSNDIDGFLLGGGGKSASFETLGDSITGTIMSAEVKDQTDIATGKVQTWDNGDPKKQLVVRLQTSQRDPSDPEDDGVRAVYVKGSKKAGSRSLHDAVAGAVRSAGARSLEVGGTLTVTFDGTEPSATRGFSDRKLYRAAYAAPSNAGFLGTDTQSTPDQAPQQAAPAPTGGPTPEQVAAFQAWQASQQPA